MKISSYKNLILIIEVYKNLAFKQFLAFILIATSFALKTNAQFYDSDDEIRIYVLDMMIQDPGCNYKTLVFNFNREKAAMTSSHSTIYAKVLEDEYFYEKYIYGPNKKILNYYSNLSTPNKTVYGITIPETGSINKYIFTDNGNHLEVVLAGNREGYQWNHKYTRVSKDKLIELILAFINKQNGTWR